MAPKIAQLPQTTHEKKGKSISAVGLKKPKVFFDFFPNYKNLIHGQLDIEHKKKKNLVFSAVQITATVSFLKHPNKKNRYLELAAA